MRPTHTGLAELARQHLRNHACLLCGSEEPHVINSELGQLREGLEARLREQQAFEEIVRLARSESESLRNQEIAIQARVNEIRFTRDVVSMVERNLPQVSAEDLRGLKARLEDEEADSEAQMIALRQDLAADYESFREKVDARMDKLRTSYAGFATDFLGLPCELEEVSQGGLLELRLFVPKFEDVLRNSPESCSEAQRFFLDIAFRMALIDAAGGVRGNATFLCETPETALDITYVQNVVEMFSSFAQRQHNILLTANVQAFGIAEKLLVRHAKAERPARLVDLLEIGRLSTVQRKGSRDIQNVVERMMSTPKTTARS